MDNYQQNYPGYQNLTQQTQNQFMAQNPYNYRNPYLTPQSLYQPQYAPGVNQPPQGNNIPSNQTLAGRTVSSLEDVKPNEVAMDGRVSIFPLEDYSAIFAKAWKADGTILTVKFVPEEPNNQTVVVSQDNEALNAINAINERLDKIEKMLMKSSKQRYYNNKPKDNKGENKNE